MSRTLVDTGIQWIGKIPGDWDIVKVNKLFFRRKEVNTDIDPTVLSLARSGVKVRDISTNEGQLAESYDNYHRVYFGDLMLNPMDLVSGANCSMSEVEGVISPAYINLAKKEECNPKYYDYFFKNQYWVNAMFIHGKGVSFDNRWTMNAETIMDYKIPLPSIEEQNKIVDYLNDKCSKIDQTIRDNNKEIELLENLKEIKIYSILKNYPKVKIKYIISGIKDGTHGSFNRVDDGEYLLSSKNLTEKGIIIGDNESKISIDDYNSIVANGYPKKGDVMFCSVGNVGKTCIYDFEKSYAFQRSVSFLRTNNLMNNKILLYNTKTSFFKGEVESSINKAIQDGLYMNQIKDLKVFLPPISIQEKLANDIEKYVIKFDKIIEYRQKIIEKLEEYKKSLIYEVVTGKKEV